MTGQTQQKDESQSNSQTDMALMPLSKHLDELRSLLIKSIVVAVTAALACMFWGDKIMGFLCIPLATALRFHDLPVSIRSLAPAEPFMIYMHASFFAGVIFASPFILYQIWKFIACGLYPKERKTILKYFPAALGLFALGSLFFFFVIAPICLGFFVGFYSNYPQPGMLSPVLGESHQVQKIDENAAITDSQPAPMLYPVRNSDPDRLTEGSVWIDSRDNSIRAVINGKVRVISSKPPTFLQPEITLANYMAFISSLTLVFGLAFETPLIILLLSKLGIATVKMLKKFRRHVVVLLLLIAAIVTPPDIVSQIALAVPIYLLFELGIILAARSKARA